MLRRVKLEASSLQPNQETPIWDPRSPRRSSPKESFTPRFSKHIQTTLFFLSYPTPRSTDHIGRSADTITSRMCPISHRHVYLLSSCDSFACTNEPRSNSYHFALQF
mmetsp:Transcript_1622/g.1164  ORF Transcript_1622/g.1164 Transcript_1622/m.1164 type:complete len:107 (-) Transcript_1622:90-410(-)